MFAFPKKENAHFTKEKNAKKRRKVEDVCII